MLCRISQTTITKNVALIQARTERVGEDARLWEAVRKNHQQIAQTQTMVIRSAIFFFPSEISLLIKLFQLNIRIQTSYSDKIFKWFH